MIQTEFESSDLSMLTNDFLKLTKMSYLSHNTRQKSLFMSYLN